MGRTPVTAGYYPLLPNQSIKLVLASPLNTLWGILKNHWDRSILDEIAPAVKLTSTGIWKGQDPVVHLVI